MLTEYKRQEITCSPTIRYSWRFRSKEREVPVCLSYVVEGNRIRLPGNPGGVLFPFPIGDVVEFEELIVLCLPVPQESCFSENVYAIDGDGNLRWRIKPQSFATRCGPYVALSFHGSLVWLHCRDGQIREINARTGTVNQTH